jgi:hypothetical protein
LVFVLFAKQDAEKVDELAAWTWPHRIFNPGPPEPSSALTLVVIAGGKLMDFNASLGPLT